MHKTIALFKSITIFEIVLTTVLAVALGVAFWGWTFIYEVAKPFLKISGLAYLVAGFWIFSSVFLSQIIRKPGIAIIASVMAAFVESFLTHWGLLSVLWGLVQGAGAELVFFMFAYKKWDLKILILASVVSAISSYALDYFAYDYSNQSGGFTLIQISAYIISAAILAGFLSEIISKRLVKLGLLDQFLIAKS
ncbi:MAG: ECF transporter S component [Bacteriovorax sp.]|jgi:energy-coupling factor transport system substrate-specific component